MAKPRRNKQTTHVRAEASITDQYPSAGPFRYKLPETNQHRDTAMDVKEAIAAAKTYLKDIYAEEEVTNLGLEEVEHIAQAGVWAVTLSFSRPWNTPRTRAQEVLENLGAVSPLKRSFKVVTIADDGTVLSMKDRVRADAAE
jgi:hypothetical protein